MHFNLLNGDNIIAESLAGKDVYISFITELELLGFQDLRDEDIPLVEEFLDSCITVDLNQAMKKTTIEFKRAQKTKLPDAITTVTSKLKAYFVLKESPKTS